MEEILDFSDKGCLSRADFIRPNEIVNNTYRKEYCLQDLKRKYMQNRLKVSRVGPCR